VSLLLACAHLSVAGPRAQQHSVRVAVWSLQRALCHCVTMSLSRSVSYHCVTMCGRDVEPTAAVSECGSSGLCNGRIWHCLPVHRCAHCVRRHHAPAALGACGSLESLRPGTVSFCSLCVRRAFCPSGTRCVSASLVSATRHLLGCVAVSLCVRRMSCRGTQ